MCAAVQLVGSIKTKYTHELVFFVTTGHTRPHPTHHAHTLSEQGVSQQANERVVVGRRTMHPRYLLDMYVLRRFAPPPVRRHCAQLFRVRHTACAGWLWIEVFQMATLDALHEKGHLGVSWYLCELPVDRDADPSGHAKVSIGRAASFGRLDVVRYLCELPADQGVDPSEDDNAAIRWAAEEGHLRVVRYLCELPVDRGVDPSAHADDTVRQAARFGHLDVVRYLCELPVDRGVNASADDDAVIWAAKQGHLDVVRYLCELSVDRGVDVCSHAARQAAERGHLSVVRYLCDLPAGRGADPSAVLSEESRSNVVRYLCNTHCSAHRLSSWAPHSSIADIQQQALTSSALSPLLAVRALVRRRRAIVV